MRYLSDIPSFFINLSEMSPLANSAFSTKFKMAGSCHSMFALTSRNARILRTSLHLPCWKANMGVNKVMSCEFDECKKYLMGGNHVINQRTRGDYLPFLCLSDT